MPAVYPVCAVCLSLATINQRYRQTDRQRSDSIGRTVLQTVGPKSPYLSNGFADRYEISHGKAH